MELTYDQIASITCGAVELEQSPEGICFHRFTKAQRDVYAEQRRNFYNKTICPAGVKLSFKTDSRQLALDLYIQRVFGRYFFSVDIIVNGEMIGSLDNFSNVEIPEKYSSVEFPVAPVSGSFDLGEGEKTVVIHLPFDMKVGLRSLCLDDGASLVPVKPSKILLAYGDSITHGYDAMHNSNRYISRLAEALDAQEFNKAIGGERYFANLAAVRDEFEPDYVVVAYGTNDWRYSGREQFVRESTGTLQNLSNNYPNAKIFVISPIWRVIWKTETAFEKFSEIDTILRQESEALPNVTVLNGFNFVPHDASYFADGTVHPTDKGFEHYFKNLWEEIKELI